MTKGKKILIGVLSVIVLIIACSGIAYAVAPRDFLQLILSDATYTKIMLASNLSDMYPAAEKVMDKVDDKKLGFDANGTMKVNLDEKFLGSADTAKAVSDYASTLKVKASANLNGTLLGVNCDLKDNDGSVLTANAIVDPTSFYLNLRQLDLGWMNLRTEESAVPNQNAGTVNQTYECIKDKNVDDDLRDAVYKTAKTAFSTFDKSLITIIPKKTLNVGSASASGDVATVVMSDTDFKKCISTTIKQIAQDEDTFNAINECLPSDLKMTYSEFGAKLTELENSLLSKLEDSKITNVTLEFYVNSRNEIVGIDVEVLSPENHFGLCAVLKDDDDKGISVSAKNGKDVIFAADLRKKSDKSGTVAITKKTDDGPLSVTVYYSDLQIEEDGIYGHFKTNSFRLPGEDEYGPIVIDAIVKNTGEKLDISVDFLVNGIGNAQIFLNAEGTEFREFTLPKLSETTPYAKEKVQSAGMAYVFGDLPKTHPDFAKVYSSVVTYAANGFISKMFQNLSDGKFDLSSLFDGSALGEGISGIVDSALNDDSGAVGGIIDKFFSAFGLK